MPDFIIEHHYTCDTNITWQCQVGAHLVRWDNYSHRNRQAVQWDYSCDCKAYQFGRGQPCKHIKAVQAQRCGWDGFTDGGQVVEKAGRKCCPKCGGTVSVMRHAV